MDWKDTCTCNIIPQFLTKSIHWWHVKSIDFQQQSRSSACCRLMFSYMKTISAYTASFHLMLWRLLLKTASFTWSPTSIAGTEQQENQNRKLHPTGCLEMDNSFRSQASCLPGKAREACCQRGAAVFELENGWPSKYSLVSCQCRESQSLFGPPSTVQHNTEENQMCSCQSSL